MGTRRAKELLLTGRPFTAAEALEWGMINRVCEPAELMHAVLETAQRIAANAPLSTRQIKQSVNVGIGLDLASALAFEIEAYNRMVPTEDRREGIAAFNEKRRPVFKGS
jgi:enoyl-CoA hydratase/carnithine racemase